MNLKNLLNTYQNQEVSSSFNSMFGFLIPCRKNVPNRDYVKRDEGGQGIEKIRGESNRYWKW